MDFKSIVVYFTSISLHFTLSVQIKVVSINCSPKVLIWGLRVSVLIGNFVAGLKKVAEKGFYKSVPECIIGGVYKLLESDCD